jgi:hypothetical protein
MLVKTIRQTLISGFVTIAIFSCVLYAGCKNKCGSLVCQNGSTCSDNKCICPTGYYGSTCSSSYTNEYVGTYDCSQTCFPASVGASSWRSPVTVAATNSGYTVTISNFAGSNVPYDATVDSLNNIQIPAGSYNVTAIGKYSVLANGHGQIVLHYTESVGSAGTYNCTMTMTKE